MRALFVAVAGATGALSRYAISAALPRPEGGFPWATLAINLAGSLVLGLVVAIAPGRWSEELRLGIGVGFLGAFTTFSTFSVEAGALVRAGQARSAAAYVVVSVLGGLALAAGGYAAGRSLV